MDRSRLRDAVIAIVVVAILVITVTLLTGCTTTKSDSHGGGIVDRSPAETYAMPDGFKNVAEKCDHHGNRLFSNSGNLFAMKDPTCNGQ